jgi:hypothetical protein
MPLLAPLFLLAMAAVAVPLLVHLVQREKRDPTAFPSLMFLETTPAPFTARRHLRNPLLLALRMLAIMALALAFARPVLGRTAPVGAADQRRREVVVLLDRSFSMRIGDRWPKARAAVDSVIGTVGAGDRMTLVAFDRRAQAVTDATGDVTALRAGLDTVRLTDESTRLTPAITVAQQRFATTDAPRTVLVVVSDFQRSAWDLTDDSRLPAGAEIVTVDVSGDVPVADRSVRAVDVREDRRRGVSEVIVTARIANVGAAARGVQARLEVGGRVLETRTVDLPADGGASVTFAAVPMPHAPVAARVVLAADAVPGDDAFHFLVQQAPALRALVIESRQGAFLTRALAIGDAPRFEMTIRTARSATAADLRQRQLVIIADGAFPSGIGATALLNFVRGGGGLLVALGDQLNRGAWQGEADVLIPGNVPGIVDRAGRSGAVIGEIDERHPALAMLSGQRSGDIGAARFERFRAIDTTAGILARFDDGSVALTEHRVGEGRVIVFGSSLDGSWNDLPTQPAFLPLMHQLTRYAANWHQPTRSLQIGASIRPGDLGDVSALRSERWIATSATGVRSTIGGDDAPPSLELREAGVHALRPGGSPGARPLLVAANIAPTELDVATFDVARLTTALTAATPVPAAPPPTASTETNADREARQSTWWYLLLAVAILLVAESVVARRAGAAMSLPEQTMAAQHTANRSYRT